MKKIYIFIRPTVQTVGCAKNAKYVVTADRTRKPMFAAANNTPKTDEHKLEAIRKYLKVIHYTKSVKSKLPCNRRTHSTAVPSLVVTLLAA